jgi:predicted dehydrogenase
VTGHRTARVVGEPDRSMTSGIDGALAEFVGAIDGGAPPMGECHDNIKSLAMALAAVESAATGTRVAVRWR